MELPVHILVVVQEKAGLLALSGAQVLEEVEVALYTGLEAVVPEAVAADSLAAEQEVMDPTQHQAVAVAVVHPTPMA